MSNLLTEHGISYELNSPVVTFFVLKQVAQVKL